MIMKTCKCKVLEKLYDSMQIETYFKHRTKSRFVPSEARIPSAGKVALN